MYFLVPAGEQYSTINYGLTRRAHESWMGIVTPNNNHMASNYSNLSHAMRDPELFGNTPLAAGSGFVGHENPTVVLSGTPTDPEEHSTLEAGGSLWSTITNAVSSLMKNKTAQKVAKKAFTGAASAFANNTRGNRSSNRRYDDDYPERRMRKRVRYEDDDDYGDAMETVRPQPRNNPFLTTRAGRFNPF